MVRVGIACIYKIVKKETGFLICFLVRHQYRIIKKRYLVICNKPSIAYLLILHPVWQRPDISRFVLSYWKLDSLGNL